MQILAAILVILPFVNTAAFELDSAYSDTALISDTILYLPQDKEGSTIGVVDSTDREQNLIQNPTLGLFKSMLVPGLGQLGNKKYFKAGIAFGLDLWFVTSAIRHGRDASELHRQFEETTDTAERNALYGSYLDSKDQRNKYTWFAVIVTFVSMFDAYADAHLSGFPDDHVKNSNKIELNLEPAGNSGVYASISYSF